MAGPTGDEKQILKVYYLLQLQVIKYHRPGSSTEVYFKMLVAKLKIKVLAGLVPPEALAPWPGQMVAPLLLSWFFLCVSIPGVSLACPISSF